MYEYNAEIIDVYDGDTMTFLVDLGFSITVKEKLRLAGINTPEVRGPEKENGYKVRDYVKKLILGKKVKIRVYKKGKFGRYIAEVILPDGKNLTKHLIEKNMGKEFMKDEY
jgi:micrococcal nuclease